VQPRSWGSIARAPDSVVRQWIAQGQATASEIGCVARHDGQMMQQRNGSDLIINPMLGIRYPQMPPHLGSITVETENTVAIVDQHLL
jgi:hypothetical protein